MRYRLYNIIVEYMGAKEFKDAIRPTVWNNIFYDDEGHKTHNVPDENLSVDFLQGTSSRFVKFV